MIDGDSVGLVVRKFKLEEGKGLGFRIWGLGFGV